MLSDKDNHFRSLSIILQTMGASVSITSFNKKGKCSVNSIKMGEKKKVSYQHIKFAIYRNYSVLVICFVYVYAKPGWPSRLMYRMT